jgi:PKHD-type hydroxylase
MDIERESCSWINYGVNDLSNTPLWGLIQEQLNNPNLIWEDGISEDDGDRKNVKISKVAWLTDLYLREQLFHSVNLYNKENWNYDLCGTDALQYGIYSEGGKYDWHIDEEVKVPMGAEGKFHMRKLSMTIWLSDPDEYEGGEFDIETEGPHISTRYDTLKLKKGSIVIFPSSKWHRVRPVTSGVRKSLVTWFRGPPFR